MHTKQPLPSERERDRQEGGVWCGSYQESLSEEREEMGKGGAAFGAQATAQAWPPLSPLEQQGCLA